MQTGSLNKIKGCQTYRGAQYFFCGKLDLKPRLTHSI